MVINSIDNTSDVYPAVYFQKESGSKDLMDRVKAVICKALRVLREVLCFPSRYLGSKYWCLKSGYHFSPEKILTPDELKNYMPYAYANASANNAQYCHLEKMGYALITPSELISSPVEGFELHEECFFNPATGVKALLFEKENEFILSFGALDSCKNVVPEDNYRVLRKASIKSGLVNLLGGEPDRYSQTERFVQAIRNSKRLSGKQLTLSGNCIGGSLAAFVSLKQKIPAICINSLPLGAGLQQKIGNQALSRADQYIINISIQSDWASNPFILSTIDRILSFLGIRTPGNFGSLYRVPTSFGWDFCSTHRRVLTSLHNHVERNAP